MSSHNSSSEASPDNPLHDTELHAEAGWFGVYVPGCPRCEQKKAADAEGHPD